MADARVSNKRLNEAFQSGATEMATVYYVRIEGRNDGLTATGTDRLMEAVAKIAAHMQPDDRIIVTRLERASAVAGDDDDEVTVEVIDVTPAD